MIGCLVFKSAVNFQTVFSQTFAELNLAICVLEHYNTPHISDAGWSSLVARRAHNPKAVGSNPAPATNHKFSKKNPNFGVFLYDKFVV